MKRACYCAIASVLFLLPGILFAEDEGTQPLKISAFYKIYDDPDIPGEVIHGTGRVKLVVIAVFQNTGSKDMVLLKGLRGSSVGQAQDRDQKVAISVSTGIVYRSTVTKAMDVPSAAEVMPVTLRKNDAVQFSFVVRFDPKFPDALDRFEFRYFVDERVAERFGAWSGKLACRVEKLNE